jgi:hypothetical protein
MWESGLTPQSIRREQGNEYEQSCANGRPSPRLDHFFLLGLQM